jgi:hypothetical protein
VLPLVVEHAVDFLAALDEYLGAPEDAAVYGSQVSPLG